MNSATLNYAVHEGVATITLNRPHVMNALDADMIGRLRGACEAAREDAAARVIVLR
jgi:enoyl-CoA hydratase/carnithine racemase